MIRKRNIWLVVCSLVLGCGLALGQGAKIELTTDVKGVLPAGNGGTCIATVVTLSSKCGTVKGTPATVTDGHATNDCTTGTGSTVVPCEYTGSAWAYAGGAGSGGLSGGTTNGVVIASSPTAIGTPSAPPATNCMWSLVSNVTGSAAITPSWACPGFSGRAVTGAASSDTVLYSDNGGPVWYQGSVAVAVTLPTAISLGNVGMGFVAVNNTSGSSTAVTVTPTTWTINGNATLVIAQGSSCRISADPSGTNWDADCHDLPLLWGNGLSATRGQYGATINIGTIASPTLGSPSLGSGSSPITETWIVGIGSVGGATLVQSDASTPTTKIIAATTGVYGIAMTNQSSGANVEVARYGTVSCITDTGGATAGDIVVIGTANSTFCKDSGQTSSSSLPITSRIVGVFRSFALAGATALVELTPAHFGTQISGFVPTSVTVNGHALSSNVTVSASDLTTGTLPVGQVPTAIPIGSVGSSGLSGTGPISISAAGAISCTTCVPNSVTVNGHALSSNVTVSASDLTTGTLPVGQVPTAIPIGSVGSSGLSGTGPISISAAGAISCTTCVPNSVTVNGHALSSNVTVSATDVSTGTLPHGQLPTLLAADIPGAATVFGSGTISLPAGNSVVVGCTSTCSVPVPVPVQNYEICVKNTAGVSTVITLSALGSSALYPKPDDSGYGTAGTGTMVSTAAAGNKVCLVGRDSTHYELIGINASANWTSN